MTSDSGSLQMLRTIVSRRKRTWHELAVAMLLLLEVSFLVPWLRAISGRAADLGAFQVVLLLMLHAYVALYASRLFAHLNWGEGLRAIVLFGVFAAGMALTLWFLVLRGGVLLAGPDGQSPSLAATLISFSNGLIVILSVLYAWWRGLLAASTETVSAERTSYRFRVGVLIMGLYGVVFLRTKAIFLLEMLPVFFGAALLAMALSRADTLESTSGLGRTPFRSGWLSTIVVIVGMMLLAGYIANALLQTPLARDIAGWFVVVVLFLAAILISPLLLVVYYLISYVLDKLFSQYNPDAAETFGEEALNSFQSIFQDLQEQALNETPILPSWWTENILLIRIILVVAVISLLAFAVMRISKRITARRREMALVEGDDLFSAKGLLDGMKRGLERARELLNVGNLMRSVRRELAASSIRRVYARLLDLAETHGRARKPAETPEEFLEHLLDLFPDHREQSDMITRAYVLVRYGEFPEDLVQPAQVWRSWQAIREGARSKRSARGKKQNPGTAGGNGRGNDE